MKRSILGLLFLLVLSACGQKPVPMDQLSPDGRYHYKNPDLGFTLAFPGEFIYYQTQRVNLGNYIDMEYFVPTSDLEYQQFVPGYGRPVMVRLIEKEDYDDELAEETDFVGFDRIAEGKKYLYFIAFWNNAPADWQDKWSEEMAEAIRSSFKLIK